MLVATPQVFHFLENNLSNFIFLSHRGPRSNTLKYFKMLILILIKLCFLYMFLDPVFIKIDKLLVLH